MFQRQTALFKLQIKIHGSIKKENIG